MFNFFPICVLSTFVGNHYEWIVGRSHRLWDFEVDSSWHLHCVYLLCPAFEIERYQPLRVSAENIYPPFLFKCVSILNFLLTEISLRCLQSMIATGWVGSFALGSSYISLPWLCGQVYRLYILDGNVSFMVSQNIFLYRQCLVHYRGPSLYWQFFTH